MKTIKKILITGGPCGGKTLFVKMARQHFEDLGYAVIICNETATDLLLGGITPKTFGPYEYQKAIFSLQIEKERLFIDYANALKNDKVIIFFDRGLFDSKAYLNDEDYKKLINHFKMDEVEEMNNRYDSILYFMSSASLNEIEDNYGIENNVARYEDLDEAKRVDKETKDSWIRHKNIKIIEAQLDFTKKLDNAIKTCEELILD